LAEGDVHGALPFAVNMAFGHKNNAELCNFKKRKRGPRMATR
jgi:hypothetical protein